MTHFIQNSYMVIACSKIDFTNTIDIPVPAAHLPVQGENDQRETVEDFSGTLPITILWWKKGMSIKTFNKIHSQSMTHFIQNSYMVIACSKIDFTNSIDIPVPAAHLPVQGENDQQETVEDFSGTLPITILWWKKGMSIKTFNKIQSQSMTHFIQNWYMVIAHSKNRFYKQHWHTSSCSTFNRSTKYCGGNSRWYTCDLQFILSQEIIYLHDFALHVINFNREIFYYNIC